MTAKALIHLQIEAIEGLKSLKKKVIEIRKTNQITACSSVYKRKRRDESGKPYLEIVVQVAGSETVEAYAELTTRAQGELLAVEGELRVEPTLTLPNPKLQLDPFILHLAAECAPYWEHRVRKKSLLELNQESTVEEAVEFLTQGQALINL